MSQELEISIRKENHVSVINLSGDVTAVTGQQVEDAYHDVTETGTNKIVLEFSGDNYINSGGIAFLISIAAECKEKGQTIRVSGLSAHFHKIFDMMGLTRYLEIFKTLDEALVDF